MWICGWNLAEQEVKPKKQRTLLPGPVAAQSATQ
jgi:hypothetical protein